MFELVIAIVAVGWICYQVGKHHGLDVGYKRGHEDGKLSLLVRDVLGETDG